MISSLITLSSGKIVYAHAAASPNNKIGVISSTGYALAADCLGAQAAPTTTALPTALVAHSIGKVLAAFGSTTAASNFIYSYDIDPVSAAITNVTAAYTDFSIINGPSAMVEDPTTHDVYVANGNSTFNTIEKFTFDPTLRTLTRVGSNPFVPASVYTRCVASMLIPY